MSQDIRELLEDIAVEKSGYSRADIRARDDKELIDIICE